MFIRIKHDKNRSLLRVQIVHNSRAQGKVRQKVLRHVASCRTREELDQVKPLANLLLEQLRQRESQQMELFTPKEYASLLDQLQSAQRPKKASKLGVDLGQCQARSRVMVGVREVFCQLYREFGWHRLFGARKQSSSRIVQELVMVRIWQPRSKRATVEQLQAEAGIALNLDRCTARWIILILPALSGFNKTVINRRGGCSNNRWRSCFTI